jgi:hypothetical protein
MTGQSKTILCAFVKTPDGMRVLCEVKQIIPSLYSLLPQVAVKAIKGAPFNGFDYAIVKMETIFFTSQKRAA